MRRHHAMDAEGERKRAPLLRAARLCARRRRALERPPHRVPPARNALPEDSMRKLLLLAMLVGAAAWAQEPYPSKPVKFILPFPPGGGTDILGRLIAERLAANLGQPVIAENRGGAGGNLGAEAAARAAPDGYTIVLVAPSLAISPSLYAKLNYDPVSDFAPIGLVASVPNVMVTHPSVPAQNLDEFIALAQAKPGGMHLGC